MDTNLSFINDGISFVDEFVTHDEEVFRIFYKREGRSYLSYNVFNTTRP